MTGARLGAVSYLNMLPYFHQGDVAVFHTPRALNEAARRGEVDAACMSAIAGLRAGFRPLVPSFGIGARHAVRSVYLEPLPRHPEDLDLWRRWEAGLSERTWAQTPSGSGPLPLQGQNVAIWTSGASEHSEWLARTLLLSAGAHVEVRLEADLEHLGPHALRSRLESVDTGRPVAALFIGDPALARAHAAPDAYRIDLASAWQAATGLPCVFATWFDCRPALSLEAGGKELSPVRGLLAPRVAPLRVDPLVAALERWERLGSCERREAIARFVSKGTGGSSLTGDDLASLESYLEGIAFRFDDAFLKTLAEYERLLAAQGAGSVHRSTHSPAGAHGGSLLGL